MLDIGFRDDIKRILSQVRQPHQTIFVSATINDEINHLARRYMNDPLEINVSRDDITVDEVEQFYCSVERHDKYRLLRAVLKDLIGWKAEVLSPTDRELVELAQAWVRAGPPEYASQGLMGRLEQLLALPVEAAPTRPSRPPPGG